MVGGRQIDSEAALSAQTWFPGNHRASGLHARWLSVDIGLLDRPLAETASSP
jgi:hypothetical protein